MARLPACERIVDGKPVGQDGPPTELLASNTANAVAQTSLLVNGARVYNLGNPRTVNMLNLPLELLNAAIAIAATDETRRQRSRGHAVSGR